jgi:hypothetical protein
MEPEKILNDVSLYIIATSAGPQAGRVYSTMTIKSESFVIFDSVHNTASYTAGDTQYRSIPVPHSALYCTVLYITCYA